MQFYTSGIHNIGGEVEDQWADAKEEIDNAIKDSTDFENKTWSWDGTREGSGGIIAGGDVIISGQMININGTVQSGYSSYELTLSETELESQIDAIVQNWKNNGSRKYINFKIAAYLLSEGGYEANGDGTYSYRVAAWYNPLNERIVLDDVNAEGGHIYISGAIASTGGGHIVAAQGHADISVNAGNHDVLSGVLNTGDVDGLIRITDTNYADGENYSGKVSEWTKAGGKSWLLDMQGEKLANTETTVDIADGYSPQDGLLYSWTWGFQTGTTQHYVENHGFTWWGAWSWDRNPPTPPTDLEVSTITNGDMPQGSTISMNTTRPSGTSGTAVAEVVVTDKVEGERNYVYWTEYNDALHWGGTDYAEGTKTDTAKKIVTFTVAADEHIDTKFIEGSNTIDIQTGGTLFLGGSVTAQDGSVSLKAGGDILNESSSAAVSGASNLTMTAGGSIGTSADAVRLVGGSGTLNANVAAGENIYLDGASLTSTAVAGSFCAGNALEVTAANDIDASFEGTAINVESVHGAINANVKQLEAIDGSQRFDASASGDINVTVDEGDLGLGKLASAGGDVTITVASGDVYDAIDRSEEAALTAEERIALWKEFGIIGENGGSTGDDLWAADMAKAEGAVRNDYARYEAHQNVESGTLTEAQQTDFSALCARFGDYASVDAAIAGEKADANSDLGKLQAAQGNYGWTQDQLMYAVAEAIANPDPGYTPVAGEANVSGKRVVINSESGGVGINNDAFTGTIDTEMLKLLAQADVDDVTWNVDGTVTVELKNAVTVEALQGVAVDAERNVFVQSTDDTALNVEHIVARSGALRLTSSQGIYGVWDDVYQTRGFVSGTTATLRGGEAGVGAEDAAIHVHHGENGWAALSSEGDIYVDADGESLTLYSVSGGSDVTINAADLYAYSDGLGELASLGYIAAGEGGTLYFNVAGDFGTTENALRVASDATVLFEEKAENVWLETVGTAGTLSISGINASGTVDISATSGLEASGIAGDTVTLNAETDIALTGDVMLAAEGGTVTLTDGSIDAAGNVAISGLAVEAASAFVKAGEALSITTANGAINAEGAELEAVGNVSFIAASDESSETPAAGDIRLSGGSLLAGGSANLTAEGALAFYCCGDQGDCRFDCGGGRKGNSRNA